jgi:Ca-activated chloride channel homolog
MMKLRNLLSILTAVALTGCVVQSGGTKANGSGNGVATTSAPNVGNGKCTGVEMAVSSEKIALMDELAKAFNDSKQAKVNGTCVVVHVTKKSSGAAATALINGWANAAVDGPQPVVWSPAASGWAGIVNQRAGKSLAPEGKPFMLTPLVIAMPAKMAQVLGYPGKPLGFKDIVQLANDKDGWAKYGHPEWGPFRLGKTNPNYSTSGLNFTVAQYYAATGKSRDLTAEDLDRPDVTAFSKSVESAVVHYGDITMTFLNNWFAADFRGSSLSYASAVAVEEKSVIDYNLGNPDGELSAGERPRIPREPLVAIYPSEGTLYSDSPFIILDAPWVTPAQKQAASLFGAFVMTPENQAKVLTYGFRPGNPAVAIGSPIELKNGVDPAQPSAVLDVPPPSVMIKVLDSWAQQRKSARVLIVMDVSGSMGQAAVTGGNETKLDLAKRAAISALSQFKDDDEVGLRIFSTGLSSDKTVTYIDLAPVGPVGVQREGLRRKIDGLSPVEGTPLYAVTEASFATMTENFDPTKINAIVLLTDGKNEDGNTKDDVQQLNTVIQSMQSGSEGGSSKPVRLFPIAYGSGADLATLRQLAEATHGAAYDASNPITIEQVFSAVVSNF